MVPMGRGGTRALALAALLGAAVAVVLIVVGQRGGGSGSSAGGTGSGRSARPARGAHPTVASGTEVRNARPQPDWRPYPGPVPILRYHVVGVAGPAEGYSELFVSPVDFRDQMDWLERHGYEAVSLETVQRAWFAGGTLPSKPIVLSFDGVEGELLKVVEPDLRRRGWPGALVLDPEAATKATAVAGLVATGWELEAEGGDPATSRRSLESRFATPVRNFAFPQGESGAAEGPALKAAGFSGATATGYGFAESRHRFDQPRITVFGLSRIKGFVEALRSRGGGSGRLTLPRCLPGRRRLLSRGSRDRSGPGSRPAAPRASREG